jgi:ribonuclease HII
VRTIVEDGERSTYEIGEGLVLSFEVGAEERHLPVALASMGAKFVRELSMRRLNAFFTARMPSLAPTAGYVEDGRRYLAEVKPILAAEAIREQDFVRVV